jgi:hypothetical protein
VQLSEYSLEGLRDDGEFIVYRAHGKQLEQPSVLLLAPSSTRPSPETLRLQNVPHGNPVHSRGLHGHMLHFMRTQPLSEPLQIGSEGPKIALSSFTSPFPQYMRMQAHTVFLWTSSAAQRR